MDRHQLEEMTRNQTWTEITAGETTDFHNVCAEVVESWLLCFSSSARFCLFPGQLHCTHHISAFFVLLHFNHFLHSHTSQCSACQCCSSDNSAVTHLQYPSPLVFIVTIVSKVSRSRMKSIEKLTATSASLTTRRVQCGIAVLNWVSAASNCFSRSFSFAVVLLLPTVSFSFVFDVATPVSRAFNIPEHNSCYCQLNHSNVTSSKCQ